MNEQNKALNIDDLLSERRLCEWLDLPVNPATGQSKSLASWIAKGLKFRKVGQRRFFFVSEVIDFIDKMEK
jgi:hypothetical protein